MTKKSILISAYACEPNRGSEPGVGWNWTMDLASKYEEVHVVTRTGDRYVDEDNQKRVRDSQSAINQALKNHPFAHKIHFHYFDLPSKIANWERSIGGDIVNIYLWELVLFFFLRKKFKKNQFDVAQKVTIVSHRFPSLIWYFAKTYIHGPIAGGERFPLSFLSLFSAKNAFKELVRLFFQWTPLLDPFVRISWRKAQQIIAVTPETRAILPHRFQKKCLIKQAATLKEDFSFPESFHPSESFPPLKLLFVGKLVEWKGLGLLLRAIAELSDKTKVQLTVVGSGPDKEIFEEFAIRKQLPVQFLGQVPRTELSDIYASHDLFSFPSLRDSGGFVVLEAKSFQLPCLVLNLGGPPIHCKPPKDIVIGIKGQSVETVIRKMAGAIEQFYHQKFTQRANTNHS